MGLNLLRSMMMMTAMGGKNTMQNTALEEDRRRRKKAIKRLFWRRRRNSRTYKLRPAIKPLLLVAADNGKTIRKLCLYHAAHTRPRSHMSDGWARNLHRRKKMEDGCQLDATGKPNRGK